VKTAIFCTCGSNNWETVEDRWVHAASGLASTELFFFSIYATFCVIATGASSGQTKKWSGYVKMAIFLQWFE